MPYDPNDPSSLPDRVRSGLSPKKQRQWAHVWNSVYRDTKEEGRAFAAANSITGLGKSFEHLVTSATSSESLNAQLKADGFNGWRLINIIKTGNVYDAYLEREIIVDDAVIKSADDALLAPQAPALPVLDADRPDRENRSRFSDNDPFSFWGLVPNSPAGERRVEAKTALTSGLQSKEHGHKCVLVIDKDKHVLMGMTDFYSGHTHTVTKLGATNESDGHTHSFELLEERDKFGDTPYK